MSSPMSPELILRFFTSLGSFFTNLVLSLMVAIFVAMGFIGFFSFKSSKKTGTKVGGVFLIVLSFVCIVMVFWSFIIYLTLKEGGSL